MTSYPHITYRYPTLNDVNVNDLRTWIVLDWNDHMNESFFSNPITLNEYVKLFRNDTNESIPLEFVQYEATNRRVVIRPAVDLVPGAEYRVFVAAKIPAVNGRKSTFEYTWTFKISGIPVSKPDMIHPPNFSVQPSFPLLAWSSVPSAVAYQVVVDDNPTTISPVYEAITVGTNVIPTGTFDSEKTYFWKVRALTAVSTGPYSDTWSFFYGDPKVADVTNRVIWEDPRPFQLKETGFEDGLSNQYEWPTIWVRFNSPVASGWEQHFTVVAKSQLPRNDKPQSYQTRTVAGSAWLDVDTIWFVPEEQIEKNTRYEVRIGQKLRDINGETLPEPITLYFTSRYDPYYVDLAAVRARLMSSELNVPDDLINFYIFQASLEAKARVYGYLHTASTQGFVLDTLKEAYVRDTANLDSYGALKWVEAAAVYKLLTSILIDEIRNIGRRRELGDYSEQLSADILEALKQAIDNVRGEMDQWEDWLVPSDVPVATTKNALWSPLYRMLDLSVRDVEGRRGPI